MSKMMCKQGVWLRADIDLHKRLYMSPPCGLKSCPTCSKLRQNKHRARIYLAWQNNANLHWYFVTATARSQYHKKDPKESLDSLRKSWSVWRKKANRKYKKMMWVKVYEKHKSGVFHLHVIVATDEKITADWIKKSLWDSGFGYQHKRVLLKDSMVLYVIKYSTKADIEIRAIEYSRDFPKQPKDAPQESLEWQYLGRIDIETAIRYDHETGRESIVITGYEIDSENDE